MTRKKKRLPRPNYGERFSKPDLPCLCGSTEWVAIWRLKKTKNGWERDWKTACAKCGTELAYYVPTPTDLEDAQRAKEFQHGRMQTGDGYD